MAFLEAATFCSPEEYKRGLAMRSHENQIRYDDIYMMLMSLKDHNRAAKWPIKLLEIAPKVGFTAIKFSILDRNLQPVATSDQFINNGIVTSGEEDFWCFETATEQKYLVTQSYFKDYFEDQIVDLLLDSNQLSLVG